MSTSTYFQAITSRRGFLARCAGGLAGVSTLGPGLAVAQTSPASPGTDANDQPARNLTVYPFGGSVWVRVNDKPLICYRAHADMKAPYFYPFIGPGSGLPMTDEAPDPARYPHHRSVFFGCDAMNGSNFWQQGNDRGQIVSRGPQAVPVNSPESRGKGAERVLITDTCDWRVPGKDPIIEDRRNFVIHAPNPDTRLLDASITLSALADIHVSKTNHSLFAVRAVLELAPLGGGRLVNSEGQEGQEATLGQPAAWCGFQGTRLGVTESIVLMDHPKNPWSPGCPWLTRDYGFISPTPFNWLDAKGWNLPKGKSIQLKYRVAVFKGPIEKGRVESLWSVFAKA